MHTLVPSSPSSKACVNLPHPHLPLISSLNCLCHIRLLFMLLRWLHPPHSHSPPPMTSVLHSSFSCSCFFNNFIHNIHLLRCLQFFARPSVLAPSMTSSTTFTSSHTFSSSLMLLSFSSSCFFSNFIHHIHLLLWLQVFTHWTSHHPPLITASLAWYTTYPSSYFFVSLLTEHLNPSFTSSSPRPSPLLFLLHFFLYWTFPTASSCSFSLCFLPHVISFPSSKYPCTVLSIFQLLPLSRLLSAYLNQLSLASLHYLDV